MESQVRSFRIATSADGWQWIKLGVASFMRQPWMWIGITLLMQIILAIFGIIPVLGWMKTALSVVFYGGLLLGCAAVERDGELEMGHLFAGFGFPFKNLAVLGLLMMLAWLLVAAVAVVLAFPLGLTVLYKSMSHATMDTLAPMSGLMGSLAIQIFVWGAVVLILATLVALSFMFAPALVTLAALSPLDAIRLSFQATWDNWRSLTVYGLCGIAVLLGLVVLMVLCALAGPLGYVLVALMAVAGGLCAGPITFTSTYFAYRTVFADYPDTPQALEEA